MEFLLLTLDGAAVRPWSKAQERAGVARMRAFRLPLEAAGKVRDSGGVGPDFDAVRIRVKDGEAELVEGPFTDAEHVVGGFMIIECASREEALEIARQCPAAEWAPIEVRQLWRH
jgi:hypothetical protein